MQIAWDATSLRALQFCPRYYQYTILQGWRSEGNADTHFGGFFADAVETYKKARLDGHDKEEAQRLALCRVLSATYVNGQPWGGSYDQEWHCAGDKPYRNSAGNRAKCPWAHKGSWFPSPAPSTCGACGGTIVEERRWVSDNPAKDRLTLVRLVSWWCDDQPEEGGLAVYKFPDGTPAVELSWTIPLPWKLSGSTESFLLCGHFDSIDQLDGEFFIADNKTTKAYLNKKYWSQYKVHTQVDTYDLAGTVLYPDLGISGVRIDAAQTMVGGAHFGAQVFYRNDAQREETLRETEWWLRQAERYATDDYYPRNKAACYMCDFKAVCGADPSKRQRLLEQSFTVKHWNPLEER